MKFVVVVSARRDIGRPPHGGRGLKLDDVGGVGGRSVSPPSRGAWIEILYALRILSRTGSPPSRGAWIEIDLWLRPNLGGYGRPPHGGRGLKFITEPLITDQRSRPPHGGRGLKLFLRLWEEFLKGRPPHGGRGLKCLYRPNRPIRRRVAPLTGGVD